MKSSRPPALATWLLEHLLPERERETLIGDLLETFWRHGSAWYWRQVLAAIMAGFLQELRARRIAICWAIAYSSVVPWVHIWVTPQLRFLLVLGIRLPWPISLVLQIAILTASNFILIMIALGLYLGLMRHFDVRRFSQSLLTALPVIALGVLGTLWVLALRLPQPTAAFTLRLPLLFGLLVSMWIVAPSVERADAKKSLAVDVSNA
jgi:hypothetical protein